MSEQLLPNGVPGLEIVLNGPIEPGTLAFIVGPPGAGKTVLASQIIFAAARQGLKTIIFTSYSETQSKLLQHLGRFAFFDAALVGDLVTVLSLPSLTAGDAASATATLIRNIRQNGGKLVMLDGFQSVEPMLGDPQALRHFLAGISTHLDTVDASLLITLTGDARDPRSNGMLTVADLLIGLGYQVAGTRHTRSLEVVKQRGRAQLSGTHAYRIDSQGITIFPRIESYPLPQARPPISDRQPFGLPELDAMLRGGLHCGTTSVLAGVPGAGKTLLALHWALQAARPEAPTLYLSFREQASQLALKAQAFGLNLDAAFASGAVRFLRLDPVELDVDQLASLLLSSFADNPARLVVDDLTPLLRELGSRADDYLAALAAQLYAAHVTTLSLLDTTPSTGFRLDLANTPLGSIGENVLLIQQQERGGELHSVLGVLRMRLSAFDRTLRELLIDEQEMQILPWPASAPQA